MQHEIKRLRTVVNDYNHKEALAAKFIQVKNAIEKPLPGRQWNWKITFTGKADDLESGEFPELTEIMIAALQRKIDALLEDMQQMSIIRD
jgi:hypothetical protein